MVKDGVEYHQAEFGSNGEWSIIKQSLGAMVSGVSSSRVWSNGEWSIIKQSLGAMVSGVSSSRVWEQW